MQPDKEQWDPGRAPNEYILSKICGFFCSSTQGDFCGDQSPSPTESRTELDTHANMPVVGCNVLVTEDLETTVDVAPFSPSYPSMQAKLVNAAIRYECPYTGEIYILLIYNAIHVPAMTHNLIPPFVMREAGIVVNDVPKIQVPEPSENDHAIIFHETNFRIPLSLIGVFSFFKTSKPSVDEFNSIDEVYTLTPTTWNPHSTSYARNEESMVDWQGGMIEKRHRHPILLEEIEDDPGMAFSLEVGTTETNQINQVFHGKEDSEELSVLPTVPRAADEVNCGLHQISPLLCLRTLCFALEVRAIFGNFQVNIGATTATAQPSLLDKVHPGSHLEDLDAFTNNTTQDHLHQDSWSGTTDLDLFVCATHARPRMDVDAQHLAKIWRIDHDTARRTLEITTQRRKHAPNSNLTRNYSTKDRMLRYKRIADHFFMDTFFATIKGGKSSRGNTCCQLFVTDKGFLYVVPMKSKKDTLLAVKQFAKEIGAPEAIISDPSGEQTSHALKLFCNEIGTTLRALEEGTPWANRAELYIGLIKEAVRKDMKETTSPLVFWDYCVERRARINNVTAKDLFQLHGTNAHTATLHEEADISNLARFGWYDWCYHWDHTAPFPHDREILGRVLGPARGHGNEMAQWILKSNGNVVPRRTLRPLREEEKRNSTVMKHQAAFDELIQRRWNPSGAGMTSSSAIDESSDEDTDNQSILNMEDAVDATGKLLNRQPSWDVMLQAEIEMNKTSPVGTSRTKGIVKRRAISPLGKTTGSYDPNPRLNTMVYEVEFDDGEILEYSANAIAENMLSQIDSEGFSVTMLEGIVDHRKNEEVAVPKKNGYAVTQRGQKKKVKTTKGWKLLVRWKDKSETWVQLKDLKASHPIEVAEYAKARGIDTEPAFAWWVPYTMRKRDVIISAVKNRIKQATHKYGVEIPRSVEHAHTIDRKNGNSLWKDAINKEMLNVGIAFEVLEDNRATPVGWSKVTGHMIFDVKMDFTRKARWVLDGHRTPDVEGSTYAGVVSRESVRIALTYAALNGLQVCTADIRNAYLQAPSSQKDYVVCGPEFGLENVGKRALIHRALYGGKAAGRDFRNHLRSCMQHLGYESCRADPDVWMRPAIKPDGTECYEYILLYVDDALAIGVDAENMLRREIGRYFELKEESIGPPKIYLGGQMQLVELSNGAKAWGISSSQYVQAAVNNVEKYLQEHDGKLPKKADTPMRTSYSPELDDSEELEPQESAFYQSAIGILRWMVELGRVDICLEVSLLSSHLALPRRGHLDQVYHIFSYLKSHHNAELVLDPSDPAVDEDLFEQRDWTTSEFGHIQGIEEKPDNMPLPRGQAFVIRAKVDADHATDTVSRRSRTGFLVWLNCALVYWMSKKQTSVETSSFGSEFIAMKQCCEYIRGLRYKLRMMGIPCVGPAYIYGDNQSVLANTTVPDSVLKKKSQSIAYHFVREGCARDEWRMAYVSTHENESDLLTKLLPHGEKRKGFVRNLLYHVYDY
jgi:hypothetical protein